MGKKIARIIGRVLLVVLVTIVMLVGTLFIMIKRICSDSAPAARNLFISTVLESGQMKFLASWFCTDAQINEVINANKMESMDSDIDTSLINISTDTDTQTVDNNGEVEQFDGNGIRMVEISGRSFFGKMLIIKDPSQVKVGTTYPWGDYGKELHEIVSGAGAVAGVNGGLGLNGIKSLILPLSDSLKMSVLFKAVSMIPGIGNSAQTVSKTIVGSAVLVKNSIGVAAVIVMAVTIGIPILKLVVMAFLYQILGAVLEPVADSRIVKAVLVLSESLENMIYMIAVTVVLMCLTMAIICFATNINLYV